MANFLIAGATSDIAQALIKQLSQNPENKLCLIARNADKLSAAASNPSVRGFVQCDFSKTEELSSLLTDFLKTTLPLAGFAYCAGITRIENLSKMTYPRNLEIMSINYFSFVELLRLLLKIQPRNNPFRTVVLSSAAGSKAVSYTTAYSASKAAINAFVRSSASELIKRGCLINAISPSYVDTQMLSMNFLMDPNFKENVKSRQPQGLIPPEAIAYEMASLLEKPLAFETGTIRFINGGAPI